MTIMCVPSAAAAADDESTKAMPHWEEASRWAGGSVVKSVGENFLCEVFSYIPCENKSLVPSRSTEALLIIQYFCAILTRDIF